MSKDVINDDLQLASSCAKNEHTMTTAIVMIRGQSQSWAE